MQSTLSSTLTLLAWLATSASMGAWVVSAFIRPRTGDRRTGLAGDPLTTIGGIASLIALAAAVAHVVTGPGTEHTAWIVAAVCFALAALLSLWKVWESALYALLLQAIAVVAPVAATEATIPQNHDVTGDAGMVAMVASAVLAGTWAFVRFVGVGEHEHVVGWRMRFLSTVAGVVIAFCDLLTIALQPGGRWPLDQQPTWHLIRAIVALAIAALAWLPRRTASWPAALAGLLLMVASVGTHVAGVALPAAILPMDVRTFGYSVAPWPTLRALALDWRINLFFFTISILAVAVYLFLVAKLHRQGDHWPLGRTVAWIIGWTLVCCLTSSGVGRYAPASFSVHMFMNLGLNMAAAMILALGGFITLVLRANKAHGRNQPAGLREWVAGTMHSRYLGFIYNPLVALAFMTGTYYVFYLTQIYPASLQWHWLHQFVYLHFLASGYIFYGLIIGVDQPPHPLPHIGKLGLIIGAMPFHAFFGVILMSKTVVYAEDFLASLGHEWLFKRGLQHDQWVGAAIAWGGGEFPLFIALIALLTQWQRQDTTEARRTDRHLDSGTDQSYDAYNEMMARLAAADRAAERSRD